MILSRTLIPLCALVMAAPLIGCTVRERVRPVGPVVVTGPPVGAEVVVRDAPPPKRSRLPRPAARASFGFAVTNSGTARGTFGSAVTGRPFASAMPGSRVTGTAGRAAGYGSRATGADSLVPTTKPTARRPPPSNRGRRAGLVCFSEPVWGACPRSLAGIESSDDALPIARAWGGAMGLLPKRGRVRALGSTPAEQPAATVAGSG